MTVRGWRLPAIALVLGVVAVWGYDRLLEPYRYPYSVDTASYVEMATSLAERGAPSVTPWDPGRDPDAIPQILFPPGFSALIALAAPVVGGALEAARLLPRFAAALLPMVIVLLFRGMVSDSALALVAAASILAPGVREWHYMAYSDVPALLLAVGALGLLARVLFRADERRQADLTALVFAGLLAGFGVAVRTAGVAVLVASVSALGYARWIGRLRRGALRAWLLGTCLPLGGLLFYNLRTFGRLQPYDMPPSLRPFWPNLLDYAHSQVRDVGVPDAWLTPWPVLSLILLVGLLIVVIGRLVAAPDTQRGLWILLLSYVVAGAGILVVSRTRYEWGGLIDARHTLQLAWAVVLGVAMWVEHRAMLERRLLGAAAVMLLGSLITGAVLDIVHWRQWGPQAWRELSGDREVLAAVGRVPRDIELTSNAAAFFRLEASHAVRDLEVGGTDRDFVASLQELVSLTAPRPTLFVLVCDEFTGRFTACGGAGEAGVRPPLCEAIRVRRPRVALCQPQTRSGDGVSQRGGDDESIG